MSCFADQNGVHIGRLTMTPAFLFGAVLIFCVDMTELLPLFLLAALLHECGHLLACYLFQVPVWRFRLTCCGGELVPARHLAGREECVIALSGPAINLLLAFALIPLVQGEAGAIFLGVNLMLGLFNLLPMLPLDGGRVLHGVLVLFCPEGLANRLLSGLSDLLLAAGLIPAALLLVRGNPSLMVVVLCLGMRKR